MNWWNQKFVNKRDYILDRFEDLSLTCEESMLLLLIDFMNQHQIPISYHVLANKMKLKMQDIDYLLTKLSEKEILKIDYSHKEVTFSIDGIFEIEKKEILFDEDLFHLFEDEFSRMLTQIEMQRMSMWLKEFEKKQIIYALREAILYEKRNFDYIERILQDWKKRKFTVKDYEEGKR